ncbi:tricorn protease [Pedobacter steynii]|uniref:Tricorn protease homolog n=1 Tax=Pedobacter steynii TaxID=430522 RepID=A0A1H0EHT6_9SPHI|nr:S41 family peptidase [Pedobacter steynii]NQX42022.1 PD40 domain-containing protein [Pedobacter steynii]SDN82024.1 tricorn protease [Pedobacter steynii]
MSFIKPNKLTFLAATALSVCMTMSVAFTAAAQQETLLIRSPAVSANHLAFVYGGDIWISGKDGSNPRRLTVNPAVEQNPLFSPDGKQIAFTGNYDGNTDVYVIPIEGGAPKRVTFHPNEDLLRGWIGNDQLYFTSTRDFHFALSPRLHKVNLDGTGEQPLPMPEAVQGSPSPDGRYWAYIKNTDPTERARVAFKRYRGGGMPQIWIFDTKTNHTEIIPGPGSNNVKPQWLGNKVYFLSDRDLTMNLFSYDVSSKKTEKLTDFKDYDIKTLTAGQGALAFEQGGKAHLLETANGKVKSISISIQADAPYKRPHYIDMAGAIGGTEISPTGVRALFESRGEIFSVPKEKGDARNISNSPGSYEKFPSWSPDGKYISYLSDKNGSYQLVLLNQVTKEAPIYISLGNMPFYYQPIWSPDSKKLVYGDTHLNLFYIDINDRKPVLVKADKDGSSPGRSYSALQPAWSPDSKWISYVATLPNAVSAAFLYNVDKASHTQVTDGMSNVNAPSFSRDGKYLFFTASTDVGLTNSGLHMSAYQRPVNYNAYALILSKKTPSLYKTESDEESVKPDEQPAKKTEESKKDKKGKEDKSKEKPAVPEKKSIEIDLADLSTRVIALPIPAGSIQALDGNVEGQLLYFRNGELGTLDLKKMETTNLASGVNNLSVSADGKSMMYSSRGNYYIVDAAKKPATSESGKVKLDGIKVLVDPAAEWKQMFNEVWKMEKDLFYVENMHGADWPAMKVKYEKFLPYVNHRSDLSYLFNEMMGEMVVGHNYIYPGDEPNAPAVGVGMLGADYEVNNGFYKIGKIFTRLDWNPSFKAPLAEPGLNIKEGDYIVAIEGVPLTAKTSIYSFFDFKAGKQVAIKINSKPSLEGAREVVVVPVNVGQEMELRKMDWVENNRKRVDKLSNGQIAYVYMPNTGPDGYSYFNRYYFSQMDKKALLMDERNNGGGWVADYVIDLLSRELISYWAIRDGKSFTTPGNGIFGPKAMLINENAGSGGDMMPYMFKNKGLGKLVGRTTMGILVGISGYPSLIDGGSITSPNFGIYDTNGKWIIENEGVAPDIFVEQTPKDLLEGRDPQLERTVQQLQEEMKTYKYPNVTRPKDPIRGH